MRNYTMQEKVEKKEAINLSGFPRNEIGGVILQTVAKNTDYCDIQLSEWVSCICKNKNTGEIAAYFSLDLHGNPGFETLWLR